MNDYNYYPLKTNRNLRNCPFSLIDMIKIKDFNKNLYIKKILKSLDKEKSKKINYLQRDNSNIKKRLNFNINLNYPERINKKNYLYYLNTDNSITLINKSDRKYVEKKDNINNSYSTINMKDKKNIKDKISDYIIKPYYKKTIIINPNPNKNKFKIKKIKLDLSSPETNNTNSFTDRTFYKTKRSHRNGDDSLNISNLKKTFNENNINKTTYIKKQNIFELNNSLISVFEENKNYKRNNNYIKYKNFDEYKEKKKKEGKINPKKNISKHSLTPDNIFGLKYKRRLAQVLILLLEKYCKIYLLKIKYLFMNILKRIIKNKRKIKFKITKRNKDITSINNFYNTETNKKQIKIKNNSFLNKYNSRSERLLIYRIKNENNNNSNDKLNKTELCRNLSELNKMKEIIERRKRSQSKEKENNKKEQSIKKYIYKNKDKNLIFNKNNINALRKIKRNSKNKKNNIQINDYNGKTTIVKKLSTWDKKINIDIKYIDLMNFENKKAFRNLMISKNFCIDLIRQASNKNVLIKRIGNRLFSNKNYSELNYKNNLGFIKEEEEKSNN